MNFPHERGQGGLTSSANKWRVGFAVGADRTAAVTGCDCTLRRGVLEVVHEVCVIRDESQAVHGCWSQNQRVDEGLIVVCGSITARGAGARVTAGRSIGAFHQG